MFISTSLVALALVVALYATFVKWRHQYWKRMGVPQLDPDVIFGDVRPMLTAQKSMVEFFSDIYKKGKSLGAKHIGIYSIFSPEYVPIDVDIIKLILIKDFNHFGSHGLYHDKKDPFSMNLFSLDGKEWKDRRIKLTPLFTTGKMKMMFETVAAKTKTLNEVVNMYVEKDIPMNIKEILSRFTTDVIGSVAFGLDCDTLNEPYHKFREIGKRALKPALLKFFLESVFPYSFLTALGYRGQPHDIESYFTQVVKDAITYREKNNVQRKDFIELMIQLKNHGSVVADDGTNNIKKGNSFVSEQEIVNEAFLFYLAGFETSSSTMTFAFFELAQHPDIQEKLRQEILETLEKNNGNLTYDAVMEMEYLDKVVKETLRKYPVVTVLPRRCTMDYQLPGSNIIIKKGTVVIIPAIGLHMDPDYYPNPDQFNPENFSPENKVKRPDCAYIPFGEGPRQCIGLRFGLMQSKMGLISLLKDFKVTLDESMKPPYKTDTSTIVYMFKRDLLLKVARA